ncbi:MAG TPA: carboxymuconolactone decarboxylase family protein [Cyclobacteriaceae bacterium]|nr:carboxymuconolactone decarboxylase family protein [Cyclobacteriaceae bacterium]
MTRLKALDPEEASGKNKELFNAIKAELGVVPNMMRTMGNSSSFLQGYLNLRSALGSGTLGLKISALIALAVAESNACNYCLSAHTYLGANLVKLDAETMAAARSGHAKDPRTEAILKFAQALVKKRGRMNDVDVATVKAEGVTDGEIAEIVGHVALNTLTNYFNNTAGTEIDFPVVEAQNLAVV